MTLYLGVDPGKATAWALLRCQPQQPAVLERYGVMDFAADETPEAWAANGEASEWLADRTRDFGGVTVAVESPSRVHVRAASGGVSPSMASGLLFAKGIAVALAAAAGSQGHGLALCDASMWRKRIVGRPNASDAQVKAALEFAVKAKRLADLPRTNCHVRDAIGVALWAAADWERVLRSSASWPTASKTRSVQP